MYRTDFEQYKNQKIKEFPALEKEINKIYLDTFSPLRDLSTCFHWDIAHGKVDAIIKKHEKEVKLKSLGSEKKKIVLKGNASMYNNDKVFVNTDQGTIEIKFPNSKIAWAFYCRDITIKGVDNTK